MIVWMHRVSKKTLAALLELPASLAPCKTKGRRVRGFLLQVPQSTAKMSAPGSRLSGNGFWRHATAYPEGMSLYGSPGR